MSDLPYVEEIRTLRAQAQRADRAYHLVVEAEALVRSLGAMLALPMVDVEVPGQDLLDRMVEAFPEVAAVDTIEGDVMMRRFQQLRAASKMLEPYANRSGELGERLHHLQHHQAEVLQQEGFAGLRAEIGARHEGKLQAQRVVQALSSRVVALRSLLQIVGPMLDAFQHEQDPELIEAWLGGMASGLESVSELAAPGWRILDEEGSAAERVSRAKEKLAQLQELLQSSERDLDAATREIAEVDQWIMERTG